MVRTFFSLPGVAAAVLFAASAAVAQTPWPVAEYSVEPFETIILTTDAFSTEPPQAQGAGRVQPKAQAQTAQGANVCEEIVEEPACFAAPMWPVYPPQQQQGHKWRHRRRASYGPPAPMGCGGYGACPYCGAGYGQARGHKGRHKHAAPNYPPPMWCGGSMGNGGMMWDGGMMGCPTCFAPYYPPQQQGHKHHRRRGNQGCGYGYGPGYGYGYGNPYGGGYMDGGWGMYGGGYGAFCDPNWLPQQKHGHFRNRGHAGKHHQQPYPYYPPPQPFCATCGDGFMGF